MRAPSWRQEDGHPQLVRGTRLPDGGRDTAAVKPHARDLSETAHEAVWLTAKRYQGFSEPSAGGGGASSAPLCGQAHSYLARPVLRSTARALPALPAVWSGWSSEVSAHISRQAASNASLRIFRFGGSIGPARQRSWRSSTKTMWHIRHFPTVSSSTVTMLIGSVLCRAPQHEKSPQAKGGDTGLVGQQEKRSRSVMREPTIFLPRSLGHEPRRNRMAALQTKRPRVRAVTSARIVCPSCPPSVQHARPAARRQPQSPSSRAWPRDRSWLRQLCVPLLLPPTSRRPSTLVMVLAHSLIPTRSASKAPTRVQPSCPQCAPPAPPGAHKPTQWPSSGVWLRARSSFGYGARFVRSLLPVSCTRCACHPLARPREGLATTAWRHTLQSVPCRAHDRPPVFLMNWASPLDAQKA